MLTGVLVVVQICQRGYVYWVFYFEFIFEYCCIVDTARIFIYRMKGMLVFIYWMKGMLVKAGRDDAVRLVEALLDILHEMGHKHVEPTLF